MQIIDLQDTKNRKVIFSCIKLRRIGIGDPSNGKMEKFFHILDTEFDERFETIDEFFDYYNNQRPSEALDYMTPNEAYKKRL